MKDWCSGRPAGRRRREKGQEQQQQEGQDGFNLYYYLTFELDLEMGYRGAGERAMRAARAGWWPWWWRAGGKQARASSHQPMLDSIMPFSTSCRALQYHSLWESGLRVLEEGAAG